MYVSHSAFQRHGEMTKMEAAQKILFGGGGLEDLVLLGGDMLILLWDGGIQLLLGPSGMGEGELKKQQFLLEAAHRKFILLNLSINAISSLLKVPFLCYCIGAMTWIEQD
ncbi:hypothetical protein ACJX0J_037403, partial [Zea mays]